MSTPNATQDGTPSNDDNVLGEDHAGGNVGTSADHVEGQESEEDAAMEAGFALSRSTEATSITADKTPTGTDKGGRGDDDGAGDGDGTEGDGTQGAQASEADDPVIPGLGKASEVRASLDRLATFEKTLASTNGHLGHLKTLVQQAGKGKAITKESLPTIREEFGDEYAEAMAKDLTAAGLGGGAGMDDEALTRVVTEQLTKGSEAREQKFERRLVLVAHKDAFDYFAGGPKSAEFSQYVQGLPKDKQEELANTWDSDVIVPHLDAFKASREKAALAAGRQERRINRGVAPTQARNGQAPQTQQDPMEAGFRSVNGTRGRVGGQGARR